MHNVEAGSILKTIAIQVRARREVRGLSRRALAERSGVSERFLAEVEGGTGNISVVRLATLAQALGASIAQMVTAATDRSRVVALLGMRGAGKSSVGRRLADSLHRSFFELDHLVEQAAGLRLSQIFELHGDSLYRRLEREVLARLLAEGTSAVVATGGSIVTDAATYKLLRTGAVTVWLRAKPKIHWQRVVRQGDLRPMKENPRAMDELRALLRAREPLYDQADHTIDTTKLTLEETVTAAKRLFKNEKIL